MQYNFGNHFICGLEGTRLEAKEKELLSEIQPIGLIFFARNFQNPKDNPHWKDAFVKLIKDSKEASKNSIRILSIDYEGGRVHRFPDEVKKFPYARYYQSESKKIALEMSSILKSFNLNMSFSPVLDVDLEEKNPVIGERAFSSDPKIVEISALDFFKIMENEKIISCGKHFPGHGRTIIDSHFNLPEVKSSIEELNIDLLPFISLINNGIPSIMSAHVLYPALDEKYPASISKKILKELLRDKLKFSNILITDDLDMKALSHIDPTTKITLALEASTDLMLVGNGMDGKALENVKSIIDNIKNDTSLVNNILINSAERINRTLRKYISN